MTPSPTSACWRECGRHGVRYDACTVSECPVCKLERRVGALEANGSR